jgi:hypothetical protein
MEGRIQRAGTCIATGRKHVVGWGGADVCAHDGGRLQGMRMGLWRGLNMNYPLHLKSPSLLFMWLLA